nr:GNAT family protein [Agarivorans sp. B2Z047]
MLRDIMPSDLEMLRQWRNDPAIRLNMCNNSEISTKQQLAWYTHISEQTKHKHFVAEYCNNAIGYVNLKLVNKGVYEAGLYMGEPKYRGSFLSFLMAMAQLDYAFDVLNANVIEAQVLISNQAAIRFNQKLGYQQKGLESGNYVDMKLQASWYTTQRQQLARFIR